MQIEIEQQVGSDRLTTLGVLTWPIWTKEISTFPWTYDATETCYFLTGAVTVTPANGDPVTMGEGDLVVFPRGMSCIWTIHSAVRKHYRFD